jgi:hypothetical protein
LTGMDRRMHDCHGEEKKLLRRRGECKTRKKRRIHDLEGEENIYTLHRRRGEYMA